MKLFTKCRICDKISVSRNDTNKDGGQSNKATMHNYQRMRIVADLLIINF